MTALPGLADGKLKDLAPAQARPARASARSAQRRGRGDPACRRGRARSGARRAGVRFRPRDHRDDRRSDPPRARGRIQGRADRRRARHGDGDRRRTPDRSDDAAPGRRDRRAPGQGGVRARLLRRRAPARLHHQRAVARAPTGRVHDYVGGLEDLAAGRVRFIGDAEARIREDYLRILRFFRFSARYAAGGARPRGLVGRDPRARRPRAAVARARARRSS